jgi:hypothetical protein
VLGLGEKFWQAAFDCSTWILFDLIFCKLRFD